jgi:hypothetical protein
MTDELIVKEGASGWTSVGTSLALVADTWLQASTSTFETLFAAVEEDYPEFECRIQVTTNTPTENNTIDVNLRMGDGTNQEPAPNGEYAPHIVGNVTLDNQGSQYYFSDAMTLRNNKATIYLRSNEASTTLTVSLFIRAITFAPAA